MIKISFDTENNIKDMAEIISFFQKKYDISVKYENEKVKLYIFNQKGGKHVEKDY